jgi:hypothetical protein
MSLQAGARIAQYEIDSALGAGWPAVARSSSARDLWRGFAEAKETRA